jgi:ATP-binding cassette subfamily F protein uup
VTSSMVFEGDGHIEEYIGGYSDWVAEKAKQAKAAELKAAASAARPGGGAKAAGSGNTAAAPASKARKLTNKEVKELEALPAQIERLEREQAELAGKLSDASFYHKDRHAVGVAEARLAEIEREHATAFARWEELEAAKNG